MRKPIIVFAGLLCSAGLFANVLLNNEKDNLHSKLINPQSIPAIQINEQNEGLSPGNYIKAYVLDVVDGDTIEVSYKKETYKVRFLCIDTPESVKPGVEVQPFSLEAADLVEKLVYHKEVKLLFDKGLMDRYGRILAYIILDDGTNLNALLIRNGYARVEFVAPNTRNKEYFKDIQQEAIADEKGLWGLSEKSCPFVKNENGEYIPRYFK